MFKTNELNNNITFIYPTGNSDGPIIVQNEMIDPYDVDGTLVIHMEEKDIPEGEKYLVQDPVDPTSHVAVRINRSMVRLLKESHARGFHVIVWSRGGWQWALNVVKALGLEQCVHQVMSKPVAYFDDTPVASWLPYRVFIGPDEQYKNNAKTTKKES